MNKNALILACILIVCFTESRVVSVTLGSNIAFSRQPFATFPAVDSDNRMRGFGAFAGGFGLQDQNTTCSFDDYFPVSNIVTMNGGKLFLLQDLVLSNSFVVNGGFKIFGNKHAVKIGKQTSDVYIPNLSSNVTINTIATAVMSAAVQSTDWSMTDQYIASVSLNAGAATELRLYYFDGSTLTLTAQADQGRNANAVRWNPVANYIAMGRNGIPNEELRIYLWNVSNGTLTLKDTRDFGNKPVNSVAWHPSGLFMAAGTGQDQQEIQGYSFNLTTGLLTDLSPGAIVDLVPDRQVNRNALNWAPAGNNYLVAGTALVANNATTEVVVFSFNGSSSLTLTASAHPNFAATAVDWSPTGSYIAVGLSGGTQRLRIYEHTLAPQGLIERQSARVGEANTVNSVSWDSSGDFLLVSIGAGVSSSEKLYKFDKTNLTLTLIATIPSLFNVNDTSWSHNDSYFVRGDSGNNVIVAGVAPTEVRFKDTVIVLNGDVVFTDPTYFRGKCRIDGRGSKLSWIHDSTEFIVEPNSQLSFENVIFDNLQETKVRCVSDSGSIIWRNSAIYLSSDYTFSRGSILFDHDVEFLGNGKFIYTSKLTSTINKRSTLLLDRGITFSYVPLAPKKNLLFFTDGTSELSLQGATLFSTRTGLELSRGILTLDQNVTFSSGARFVPEALTLKSDLNVRVLGDAFVNVQGLVRYDV